MNDFYNSNRAQKKSSQLLEKTYNDMSMEKTYNNMSMLELRPKNSMEYSKNGFPTLYKPPKKKNLNHTINPTKRNYNTLKLIPIKN